MNVPAIAQWLEHAAGICTAAGLSPAHHLFVFFIVHLPFCTVQGSIPTRVNQARVRRLS